MLRSGPGQGEGSQGELAYIGVLTVGEGEKGKESDNVICLS